MPSSSSSSDAGDVAPPAVAVPQDQEWETSLFGCFSDCSTCCMGFWCPCCLFGKNYEKLDMGSYTSGCCKYFLLSWVCCQCLVATSLRENMHKQFGLKGSACSACMATCFCANCALCQDAKEIKIRQEKAAVGAAPTIPPPAQVMA